MVQQYTKPGELNTTNAIINVTAHQVHGERALLAVLRIAALALLHEYLALAHGVTHGG